MSGLKLSAQNIFGELELRWVHIENLQNGHSSFCIAKSAHLDDDAQGKQRRTIRELIEKDTLSWHLHSFPCLELHVLWIVQMEE
jgi:hypothetical protein